jgi:hypothetical protein
LRSLFARTNSTCASVKPNPGTLATAAATTSFPSASGAGKTPGKRGTKSKARSLWSLVTMICSGASCFGRSGWGGTGG